MYDKEFFKSTAFDFTMTQKKLYDGAFLTQKLRNLWIDTMKKQVYRSGIPAGLGASATVADKVGFMNGYLNDTGICYTKNGDFAMTIMTHGSSWSEIAEIAKTIYASMN
jgi:beta-lactamase class A